MADEVANSSAETAQTATTATTTATATHDGGEDSSADLGGLTLRALVSTKEAGVVIGRGGATIAAIRQDAGVRAGVSKAVPGVHDRVLSIGGPADNVAKAYETVAQTIMDGPNGLGGAVTLRLLVSHLLVGSVIGKGGAKIRSIQETSGARLVVSKEMLPQSTERVVEVQGAPANVLPAVRDVCACLIDDADRAQGTVLYHPGVEMSNGGNSAAPLVQQQQQQQQQQTHSIAGGSGPRRAARTPRTSDDPPSSTTPDDPNWREQKISIPSDMVGCIIGRGGTKINEIRRLSGSRISIAKTAHDDSGERMFSISGLPENNEKALFLLYNQLEAEKERRVAATSNAATEGVAPE